MKSTEILDLAFFEFPQPCVILNTKFEILNINKACLSFLNKNKDQVEGEFFFSFLKSEVAEHLQDKIKVSVEKALKTGETQEIQNLHFKISDNLCSWKLKSVPLNKAGEITQIICYFEEVEVEKESLQEQRKPQDLAKNHEWRLKHPDGSIHWNREFETPKKMTDGSVWDSIIFEVTKEKKDLATRERAEKAYLESQQQFESLIRSIDGIFWEAKADTVEFTYVSPQSEQILGFTPGDWYADKDFWIKHIHPEDREFAVSFCANQVKKGKNHSFDYRMIDAHGESVWLSDMVSVIKRPGKPTILRGFMTDITKRKKTEKALEENRKRLSKVMRESVDVICIVDGEGHFLEVSKAAKRLWGYTPEELKGKKFINFVVDADKPRTREITQSIIAGKRVTNFENSYKAKCGEIVPVIWSASWDKEEHLCYAIARDARKLKAAKRKLQLSEQRFRGFVQEGGDLIALLDEEGGYIYVSPTSINVLGYYPEDFMGRNAWDFIHPEDLQKVQETFSLLENKKRIEIDAFRFKHKFGGWRWLETTITNMLNDPAVNAIVANSRDITEKKRFRDIEHLEKLVLEMNFKKDLELEQILNIYLEKIEEFYEGLCLNLQRFENNEWQLWINSGFSEKLIRAIHKNPETSKKYQQVIETNEAVSFEKAHPEVKNLFEKLKIRKVKAIPVQSSSGKILAVFSAILSEDAFEEAGLESIIDRTLGILQLIIEFKQKEEALMQSNQRFTLINEATRDAIYEWDIQQDKIKWGAGYRKLFGYTDDIEYSVEQWNDNIHPEDFEETYQSLKKHLDNPHIRKWSRQYRFQTQSKRYVQIVENGFILRNTKGKPIKMIGALRDISDLYEFQKELAISNERYKYLTKATSDAMWDWDLKKDEIYWGEGFEKLFGYKLAKITTSINTWTDNIHPDDHKIAAVSLQNVINGEGKTWEAEYRFKTLNGTYKNVFDRGYIVRDKNDKAIRAVGAMQDITAKKDYEAQLKKYTRELEVSNAELEQFAYVASHDLQEPLRMVTSFLTRLEEKYSQKLDEKALRYIDFAVDGAKRMRGIILDLLEFSRVGRSEDKIELVDINEIIEEVKSLYIKPIRESGAEIVFHDLPKINAPKSPVRQIFQNLISNALKYRKPDVKTKISINYHQTPEAYHFSIKDNGIGISSDYFEKIFIIFQRLHRRENYSGSGMGLAVTKKIVENLGGHINVESEEGQGSTFYFTIAKK